MLAWSARCLMNAVGSFAGWRFSCREKCLQDRLYESSTCPWENIMLQSSKDVTLDHIFYSAFYTHTQLLSACVIIKIVCLDPNLISLLPSLGIHTIIT